MNTTDVIIIGAGAAGLMCASQAAQRGRHVIMMDHANKAGKKILMSGGGRCNFTNLDVQPTHFLSHNPHFCKSALSQYTPADFIALVEHYAIDYHEKKHGQLFCIHKAKDILNMLLGECERANAQVSLHTSIQQIKQDSSGGFIVTTTAGNWRCHSLVIATGGLSIPTMGASPFGYRVAQQFGLKVWPTRAGLVPLTLHETDNTRLAALSGISVDCHVHCQGQSFHEAMLFTHRGLSGPAMLQISSYWKPSDTLEINLFADADLATLLRRSKKEQPQTHLRTVLSAYFAKRLVALWLANEGDKPIHYYSDFQLQKIAKRFTQWSIKPNGTQGYRTAEVTLGGVDCDALSSKTFEAKNVPGLYFIGEVLDVTGWLGGYNFQWAWSSGWVAGQYV